MSDLFNATNSLDKNFIPKDLNRLLLNKDGTPKVLYHYTGGTSVTAEDARKLQKENDKLKRALEVAKQ